MMKCVARNNQQCHPLWERKAGMRMYHGPFEWGRLGGCIVMGPTERHLQSLMISTATLREELEATDVGVRVRILLLLGWARSTNTCCMYSPKSFLTAADRGRTVVSTLRIRR